jgi:hypothetical protein
VLPAANSNDHLCKSSWYTRESNIVDLLSPVIYNATPTRVIARTVAAASDTVTVAALPGGGGGELGVSARACATQTGLAQNASMLWLISGLLLPSGLSGDGASAGDCGPPMLSNTPVMHVSNSDAAVAHFVLLQKGRIRAGLMPTSRAPPSLGREL